MPKTTPRAFDPRSADPALFHVAGYLDGVPATDLSASDLARLAFIRLDRESRPEYPTDIPDADLAALADSLTATGIYTTDAPSSDPEA